MSTVEPGTTAGAVTAILPLFLLEAMHAHDRPEEVLEDEDLMRSLPRRLGLTGVIDTQKRRYESAVKARRKVPLDEFTSLVRLVMKRPDAEAILRDTGYRMANHHFRRVPGTVVRVLRALPRSLLVSRWRKAARRLLRQMGGEHVEVEGRAPTVQFGPTPLSGLEPVGTACILYAAALEQLGELYTAQRPQVNQTRCTGNGDTFCEWQVSEL